MSVVVLYTDAADAEMVVIYDGTPFDCMLPDQPQCGICTTHLTVRSIRQHGTWIADGRRTPQQHLATFLLESGAWHRTAAVTLVVVMMNS